MDDEEVGELCLLNVPELELKAVTPVPYQSGDRGSISRGRDIVTTPLVGHW